MASRSPTRASAPENTARATSADLRSGSGVTGGPAPLAKADPWRFRQALDEALVRLAGEKAPGPGSKDPDAN